MTFTLQNKLCRLNKIYIQIINNCLHFYIQFINNIAGFNNTHISAQLFIYKVFDWKNFLIL